MNLDADVSTISAQQRSLLEALPCYVFVQRGNSVVYANRVAREILHLEDGASVDVDKLFSGQFPGAVYAHPGTLTRTQRNVFGSGSQSYSSDFHCQMRTPLDSAVPVRGSFRMLRVEPEPELLIVVLRSQHEGEDRAEHDAHSAEQGSPSNF